MPRPFRFNLQKVLDYRAQLEDQAKLALAKAEKAYADHLLLLQDMEARQQRHLEDMASKDGMSAADIWLGENYAKRLAEEVSQARFTKMRLVQSVQARREDLVNKAKERKLLEKLKETQAARHAREEERKEQAQFDEMATLRYQAPAF